MKNFLTILFNFLVFITYSTFADEQSSIQTSILTLAPTGTHSLTIGSNSYPITFANTFTATPTVVAALCQFSSSKNTNYAMNSSAQSITTSGFSLVLNISSNWNYLSYSILASIADSVLLTNFYLIDMGQNSNKIAKTKSQSLTSPMSSIVQTSFKCDILISGLNLTVETASSQFFINTTINYGDVDIAKSDFSKYNDFIFTLTSNTYPDETALSATSVSLSLNWLGNLSSLQLVCISHPFIISPSAQYPLTGGYNTVSVNSSKYNITLFDSNNNKNNLGSLNPARFYGFTSININPVTTVDANISLLYSYSTNLTSSGSTINSLSSSYFFYQKFADSILDYKFNQVINVAWDNILGQPINSTSSINSYYKYQIKTTTPSYSTPFDVINGYNYLFTLQILDQQGCYNGNDFVKNTFQMNFTNYPDQAIKTTNANPDPFLVNPNQLCTPFFLRVQYSTPVEKMFKYFKVGITAKQTSTIKGSIYLYNQSNIFYIKNIKIYQLSSKAILDPRISEVTINSFQQYYKMDPVIKTKFVYLITQKTFQNALLLNVSINNPVSLTTANPLIFTLNLNYTFSFYILDSAGNLSSFFKQPIIQIFLQDTIISTQTATLQKPFCSSIFNSTSPLNFPVDEFYLKIKLPIIVTTTSNNKLKFSFKDSSTSDHMYAIRGISIKYIEYLDPIARTIIQTCPSGTYPALNTQPTACQSCYFQDKIDDGSKCICPSNTYLNQLDVCAKCANSCYNCLSLNKCTSCIAGRTLDTNLYMCNCTKGFYDDGVSATCLECDYSCQNCSSSAKRCTSCSNGRVLDINFYTCNCTKGFYDDGVSRTCAACDHSCQACSVKATNCTNCDQGKTFDATLSKCNCPANSYDNGIQASCAPCGYSCQNCSVKANNCTSCTAGRVLDSNLHTCNCTTIGTFDDGVNLQCAACAYSCQNCSVKANKCTSCLTGRTLNTSTFMCNCATPGTFDDGQNKQCIKCSELCVSCSQKATKCTSCAVDRVLNITTSTCECKNSTYYNGKVAACQKCNQTCGNCSINAYNCTSCPANSLLNTTTNQCVCGAGYFNDTTIKCAKCINPCGNCSVKSDNCTSCSTQSGATFRLSIFFCTCLSDQYMKQGICKKRQAVKIQTLKPVQTASLNLVTAEMTPKYQGLVANVKQIIKKSYAQVLPGVSVKITSNGIKINRRLDTFSRIQLKILDIISLSNNQFQFILQNPPFDVDDAIIIIHIDDPNYVQSALAFPAPHLYSSSTMTSILASNSSNITSEIVISILLFVMLIFYILGYKHNYSVSFIQKISFLRFNLSMIPSIFSFLSSLKYSYYSYGQNALQSTLPQSYLQNSNGNFYFIDKDANMLRHIGIPILLSIATIFFRLVGFFLFKMRYFEEGNSATLSSSKKYYYRTIQFIQRTIMFPIIFFSIAEITFAKIYDKATTADDIIFKSSIAFSIIYIIYFAILTTVTSLTKEISNYMKLILAAEFLCSLVDSIIIIQTCYTNNVLTLIITIVIKCLYELYLKYTYATIKKLDFIKVIATAFQIALIVILTIKSTSLTSIYALFIIVVVIDLLYALCTTILKTIEKNRIQIEMDEQKKGRITQSVGVINMKNVI